MLRRLPAGCHAIDDATGFGTYLARLRDRHERKTAFIAKLDHTNL